MDGVRRIGLMHNKIGLEPRWYVGGYNFVLSQLASIAVRAFRWKAAHLAKVLAAVNCVIMLDMDIAISVYQEAMLEEREKRQRDIDDAIRNFDARMRSVLDSVGSSAKSLESAAHELAGSSDRSTRQAAAVAAASEEASTNVQAVAASTEELTSSIRGNWPAGIGIDQDHRHGR
jgi:methyl-accepting chemotaxis protein